MSKYLWILIGIVVIGGVGYFIWQGSTAPTISPQAVDNSAPKITSCKLMADRTTYRVGDVMTFRWESSGASYVEFGRDVTGPNTLNGAAPGGKLAPSGSTQIKAQEPLSLIEMSDGSVQTKPADKGTLSLYLSASEYGDGTGQFSSCEISVVVNR